MLKQPRAWVLVLCVVTFALTAVTACGGGSSGGARTAGESTTASSGAGCAPGEALFCDLKPTCHDIVQAEQAALGVTLYRERASVTPDYSPIAVPGDGKQASSRDCRASYADVDFAPRIQLFTVRFEPGAAADMVREFPGEHQGWTMTPASIPGATAAETGTFDQPAYLVAPSERAVWMVVSPTVFVEAIAAGDSSADASVDHSSPLEIDALVALTTKLVPLLTS